MRRVAAALAIVGSFGVGGAAADEVQLTPVATGFNSPIGIDHHPFSGKLILSVNFPSGLPYNFELVGPDGTHSPFSTISGLTDEVKIATVRPGPCQGGFIAGEVFTGTGVPGVIARIAPEGNLVENPWVTLPGETGLLRGSLFQDRYCAFGGDLVVVTTDGNAWRVSSAGVATRLAASLGTHLEGLTTVPNDPTKYGPWAGRALAGAEDQARIYAIGPDGAVDFYELGIRPEDIEVIPAHENFYGVDFGGSTIWGASPDQFADKVGDMLMSQESPGILWHVRWNGSSFEATEVARVTQWEHITFSPAGVPPIPPATPCSRPTLDPPADSTESGLRWSMGFSVSANDGLIVRDVTLGARYMAEQMSLPYYVLQTSAFGPQRAELKPNGDDASARSRLVGFERTFSADKIMLKATYAVDRIPARSESCLIVEQTYEFAAELPNGGCEPSQSSPIPWKLEPLPCNPWKPQVSYTFTGSNGETLTSINMPLRLHFRDENKEGNFAATFQDNDNIINAQASIIRRKEDIRSEKLYTAIKDGGQAGDWDNYHQTYRSDVRGPSTIPSGPGCPECIHIHWRWGKPAGPAYGDGLPLIPKGSNQGVEFTAVRWHPGEEDPQDFKLLLDDEGLQNEEMVFWYSPTGHQASDTFFQHGGFFSTLSHFADLALTASVSPDPVTVGGNLAYTFTVTNNGPAKATGVNLYDIWSLGGVAQFVPAESSNNCRFVNGQVTCSLGNLQSGMSRSVSVAVRTLIPIQITNIALVESKEVDQEPDNNETRLETQILVP